MSNLNLYPRPPSVWIYTTGSLAGQPTPEFFRFIASLLNLAGGSADFTIQVLEDYVMTQGPPSTTQQDNAIAMLMALVMSPVIARAAEIEALRARIANLEARLG